MIPRALLLATLLSLPLDGLLAAEPAAAPRAATAEDPMKTVTPGVVDVPTARRLVEAGAVVVDVRTAAEFSAGHVAGAKNIPFDEIARRASEIGPPSTPVVVYCRSGNRSGVARQELGRLGYAKVWDFQRWDAWEKAQ